ncbi:hypothetical protein GKQ38_04455 [Candidatus Nanohaloarchaea archaeon]|nr:hypothetical protein GKQ38_04455 [Candidatus Nanohaloarchaea archaeon]
MVGSADIEKSLSEALSEAKKQSASTGSGSDVDEEELKKEIRRLNDRVRELEEANSGGKVLVEEDDYSDLTENDLKQEVDKLEISQAVTKSDLEERMEDFRDEVFEQVFSAVENRLAEENFREKVNSIRSDADDRIESIQRELEDIEIEEKVDSSQLDRRIQSEREEIDNKIDFRYNEVTSEINDVRKNMEALRSNVSEAHDKIGSLRDKIERMQEEGRRIESDLKTEIEDAKEEVQEDIEPVPAQDDFDELQDHVEDISGLLDEVSKKLAGR